MHLGIPRETKTLEGRVGLIPAACEQLVRDGHTLLVESSAGTLSGYHDQDYERIGARIVDRTTLFADAQLIIKVKEPQPEEIPLIRDHHLLFCFLHLAALPQLQQQLVDSGCTAVAFETVIDNHRLPVLAPMSEIAGKLAIQYGATLLHHPAGGRGLLIGGMGATERGRVVILGGGNAGGSAAFLAAAMGANVTLFDIDSERLRYFHHHAANITAEYAYPDAIAEAVETADLVVGAVLQPGLAAPKIITRQMVEGMPEGSVLVDIAVDQGGCSVTTRPTSYAEPTYQVAGVTHFCVNNMPGAVPRSASQALSAALIPYVRKLARDDWRSASPALAGAINVDKGELKLGS